MLNEGFQNDHVEATKDKYLLAFNVLMMRKVHMVSSPHFCRGGLKILKQKRVGLALFFLGGRGDGGG